MDGRQHAEAENRIERCTTKQKKGDMHEYESFVCLPRKSLVEICAMMTKLHV